MASTGVMVDSTFRRTHTLLSSSGVNSSSSFRVPERCRTQKKNLKGFLLSQRQIISEH
jgi:hypothetical protein